MIAERLKLRKRRESFSNLWIISLDDPRGCRGAIPWIPFLVLETNLRLAIAE